LYLPAVSFTPPATTPQVVSLENFSVAELMAMPQAWAILTRHLPMMQKGEVPAEMKPYLRNTTIPWTQQFIKTQTPEKLAAIDKELSQLPPVRDLP
jgi:hypothetical protein